MTYIKKNDRCVVCLKLLKRKYKYCSLHCMPIYHRYDATVKDVVKPYQGQCTDKIRGYTGVHQCPNEGLKHREGKCDDCYLWMLKRKGIYPHKDNATSCKEVYLVL